jgi:predicted small lipoprotein YifL
MSVVFRTSAIVTALTLLFAAATLAGCGQTGPLYMPTVPPLPKPLAPVGASAPAAASAASASAASAPTAASTAVAPHN